MICFPINCGGLTVRLSLYWFPPFQADFLEQGRTQSDGVQAAEGYRETLISLLIVWERLTGGVHEVDAELPGLCEALSV